MDIQSSANQNYAITIVLVSNCGSVMGRDSTCISFSKLCFHFDKWLKLYLCGSFAKSRPTLDVPCAVWHIGANIVSSDTCLYRAQLVIGRHLIRHVNVAGPTQCKLTPRLLPRIILNSFFSGLVNFILCLALQTSRDVPVMIMRSGNRKL